jgi:hypothetical protein
MIECNHRLTVFYSLFTQNGQTAINLTQDSVIIALLQEAQERIDRMKRLQNAASDTSDAAI